MDTVAALSATFDRAAEVIANIKPDQMGNATPCSEWDVAALLNHTMAVVAGMGAAASGQGGGGGEFTVSADAAGQFRQIAAATLSAWKADGVLEREMNAGAGPMPGSAYASINLLDTAGHVWDLAKATGQPTDLPADAAQTALACAKAIIADPIRPGRFAPEVPAPAGASPTDQLAAFLGRTV